jgi:tRNA uridine 5-carboxymethylaminomethyl modification enzyme
LRPGAITDSDRAILGDDLRREVRASELLRRPGVRYRDVVALSGVRDGGWRADLDDELAEQIELALEVEARYHGYIERQQREIDRHARQESLPLPADLDYAGVTGLSAEARERLVAARPATLGQASRLEGVTPSAVSLLLIHLKQRSLKRSA